MRANRLVAIAVSAMLMSMAFQTVSFAESEPQEKDSIIGVAEDDQTPQVKKDISSIKEETVSYYVDSTDFTFELPVYFANGVTDLPYVNLSDWIDVMVTIYQEYGFSDYGLSLETDGQVALITRENEYSMLIDFDKRTIDFEDYDAFIHIPGDNSLLDMVSADESDDDGNPVLFERIDRGSFDRYGREIELDLASYDIPLYWSQDDGLYLVPLQTMGDFLLSLPLGLNTLYNGKAVYLACLGDLYNGELTSLGESYFSAPYGDMSEELAWFNYCELCLALDHLYGLKEIHDINNFDKIFQETGYRSDLCSTDPNVADGALNDFIYYYLDDLHSGFLCSSYRTEEMETIGGSGLSSQRDDIIGEMYSDAREQAGPKIQSYEEVGNTAYITFDAFNMLEDSPSDYYEKDLEVDADPASEELDTVALLIYAHDQINRENSPIENVVIDLSLNGGGQLDAAAFVCAWYLGEASLSVRSSLTGAVSTGKYRADTNLDGEFDKKDTVADKNLFCLTGPYSFSCGNLVPNVFKSSGKVTILGQESGGGSCSILPMSTACGSMFQISSPHRMSFMKNGSYYDIDTGIEPDCYIMKPANFYDREALTDYINQLF